MLKFLKILIIITIITSLSLTTFNVSAKNDKLIIISPQSVNEGNNFQVLITSNGVPVEDAQVYFIFDKQNSTYTDSYGLATLTAPMVDENETFYIEAYKIGYMANIESISVINNMNYSEFEIITKQYVDENETFLVKIKSDNQYIPNVSVTFNEITELTNQSGGTKFQAPLVNSDTNYTITANKQGYIASQKTITIIDSKPEDTEKQNLEISTISSIEENSNFEVLVTSNQNPIDSVSVTFAENITFTNSFGVAYLTSPNVNQDKSYEIITTKQGYESNSTTINVLDNEVDLEKKLVISTQKEVPEQTNFEISVTYEDILIENAKVIFNGEEYFTDVNGITYLTSPSVNNDIEILVKATKTDYESSSKYITIIDTDKKDTTVSNNGWLTGIVYEDFDGSINLLDNVFVCIVKENQNNICDITKDNGNFNITINKGNYSVLASKNGYKKALINNIEINSAETTEILIELQQEKTDDNDSFLDYLIEEEIIKGSIFGIVDISKAEEEITIFGKYNISLENNNLNSDEGINLTVSADKGTGRIVLYLGKGKINIENLKVIYDNKIISHSENVKSFFKENNSKAEWILTYTITDDQIENVLIINIPKFSKHNIVIQLDKTAESIINLVNLIIQYFVFIIIVSILFVGMGLLKKRFRKNKFKI